MLRRRLFRPSDSGADGGIGNSRVRRVLAAAALAGVELDHDKSFSMRSDWKTEAFLEKFPMGALPVLEDGDFRLCESGAIAEYGELRRRRVARLGNGAMWWKGRDGQGRVAGEVFADETLLSYPCLNDLCRESSGRVVSSFSLIPACPPYFDHWFS